ncbi:Aste57867_8979 [Aphanomyces stellatus]|uniref:Aste57867_8979 protein n=1 Tax=Aphanomyces stellatus TaxID=120398 RepID=A0A485KM21_9STRA|nr:hypothetical protein As57867_008944 [Aphanomyces stellatus]VFT85863.1 Aste57867_8979 [Aphanomyces stellatus]
MDRYTVDRTIANALYGQVLLARDNKTHELVAIKKVNIAAAAAHTVVRGTYSKVPEDIDIEKHVNRVLSADGGHASVLRMRADFEHDGYDHMVFDYCNGGDLFDRTNDGPLTSDVAQRYMRQIIQGVGFMHAKGIAHRDLSLENILLHDDACYICDFGLATPTSLICKDTVGKHFYMSPEVTQGVEYDPAKADVWSLGIMLFMLLTGAPLCQAAAPRDTRFAYFQMNGLKGLLRSWNMRMDKDAQDLLEHMLCVCPVKRFTLDQVLAHPYMAAPEASIAIDTLPTSSGKTISTPAKAIAFLNQVFSRPLVDAPLL